MSDVPGQWPREDIQGSPKLQAHPADRGQAYVAVLTAQGSGKLAYSVLGEGVSCVPGAPGPGVTAGFPGGLWVGGFLELFGRPLCPAAGRTPGSGGEPPAATEAAG